MSDVRKPPTTSQLRKDLSPAASPLGTDDEAADTTPSEVRVEMAQKAERKIEAAAGRPLVEEAHEQRGSSSPYAKEEHMNQELLKQIEAQRDD